MYSILAILFFIWKMVSGKVLSLTQTQRKECQMTLQANGIQRKVGVAILISDQICFKITKVTRQTWTLYNDKGYIISRRHTHLIICTPNQH